MWFNILKEDEDEKYKKKKPKKSTLERILEEGRKNARLAQSSALNPKDPMSKDVIDIKESLDDIEIRRKELNRKIGQLNRILSDKRMEVRRLKARRRKQKKEEEE